MHKPVSHNGVYDSTLMMKVALNCIIGNQNSCNQRKRASAYCKYCLLLCERSNDNCNLIESVATLTVKKLNKILYIIKFSFKRVYSKFIGVGIVIILLETIKH